MAKIVFAWEFGGGLGHIQNILPLARKMQERGTGLYLKDVFAHGVRFNTVQVQEPVNAFHHSCLIFL